MGNGGPMGRRRFIRLLESTSQSQIRIRGPAGGGPDLGGLGPFYKRETGARGRETERERERRLEKVCRRITSSLQIRGKFQLHRRSMENRRRDGRSMENRRRDRRFKEDRDVPVLRNVYPLPPMPNGRPLPYISAPQNYQINVPPLFAMPVFPRLGSCFGCFRESSKQRLSGTQWFPYPWGGNTGAGMKFLAPLAFELGDRFDEDMFYFPGEKRRPNTRETIIRFLKQVRESKGYDVDCRPPRQLSSPFLPINLEDVVVSRQDYYVRRVHEPALFAVETINNSMENKHFELDKILKAVDTSCMLMYLTFAAREVDLDYVRTFQAMLYVPFGSSACEVWEWKFKPDFATTSGS